MILFSGAVVSCLPKGPFLGAPYPVKTPAGRDTPRRLIAYLLYESQGHGPERLIVVCLHLYWCATLPIAAGATRGE